MPDRIHVVTGIITRTGLVLLTQRGPTQSYPWMWESPGGKVEPGESDRQALLRELREELGVTRPLICPEPLTAFDFEAGGNILRSARVTLYNVYLDEEPRPLQAIGLGWFTAHDLLTMELLPANDAYRSELASRLFREAGNG